MMQIGPLKIDSRVLLAPMAGVTDHAFRVLCKEQGAGIVYTEFVSANGIIRENQKTLDMMHYTDEERPIGVQIFGEEPEVMAASAKYIEKMVKPDILDLNFGCPVPKVTKKGAGSAILKDLPLLDEMAHAIVEAVDIPVTAKIRAGWNNSCIVAPVAAEKLAEAGVAALTLHPRTTKQLYTGHADWSLITETKAAVDIPVIGNGDIKTAHDAARMLEETKCDAVMIGRRSLGNPWIFKEVSQYLEDGTLPEPVTLIERLKVCRRHLALEAADKETRTAANLLKKHLSWYLKGFPGASNYRKALYVIFDADEMDQKLQEILGHLEKDPELAGYAYHEDGALLSDVSY